MPPTKTAKSIRLTTCKTIYRQACFKAESRRQGIDPDERVSEIKMGLRTAFPVARPRILDEFGKLGHINAPTLLTVYECAFENLGSQSLVITPRADEIG